MASKLTYYKWFSIEVTHDYFQKLAYGNFNIVPNTPTAKAQRNYEIKINQQGNILTFYVGIRNAATFEIEEALKGLELLTYELQFTNFLFKNYTDILWTNDPFVLLFTPNEEQRFTVQPKVSSGDCITRKTNFFSFNVPEDCKQLYVVNALNETVISYEFVDSVPAQVFINVSQQDEGLFAIWVNNELFEQFYVSSQPTFHTIGVLQLPIKKMIEFVQKGSETNQFTLAFSARKSYWQYQVVINPNRKFDSSQLTIEGSQLETYNNPTTRVLPGGNTATVFTSSIPLKLVDKLQSPPLLTMKYKFNYSNQAHELEIKLPTPEILSMRKYEEGEDGMSFLSTTIVNV
jgi:hypothetical protein